MKKVCFLIGGLGNVFFQLSRTKYPDKGVFYSDLLLTGIFRRILGHTDHPNVSTELFGVKKSHFFFYFLILCIDIIMFKLSRRTLFSTLDCNFGKCSPSISELIYLGYFQDKESYCDHSLVEIGNILSARTFVPVVDVSDAIVIHYRKGDFVALGIDLPDSYYIEMINKFRQKKSLHNVCIVTNDENSAVSLVREIRENIGNINDIRCITGDVVQDFLLLRSAKYLIGSSSTFSITAGILSENLELAHFHSSVVSLFSSFRQDCVLID